MTDPTTLDLQTRIVNAFIDHVWLLVGLAVTLWKGFPWVLRVHGPAMVKETMTNYFNNGGGDKIRTIVRDENAMQTELHKNETRAIVQTAIQRHEEVEETRFRNALDEFEQEITDKYDLRPAPQRRRRDLRRGRR
jgi:hypothetical protein